MLGLFSRRDLVAIKQMAAVILPRLQVGLEVQKDPFDASVGPREHGSGLEGQTPTPRFNAEIYVRSKGPLWKRNAHGDRKARPVNAEGLQNRKLDIL